MNSIINSKPCYSKESDNNILNSANIKNILVLAQLNINSLRYKFDSLKCLVKDKIDLLVVTETKLDESFLSTQFSIDGFSKPVRLDRTSQGGGIIIFIRANISHQVLEKISSDTDDESIFMEITLCNSKWLLIACYNPEKSRIYNYIQNVETMLSKLIKKYDNIVMLGDLNIDMKPGCENVLTSFCNIYNLNNLIDKPYMLQKSNLVNGSIENNIFPDSLKLAEVTSAHKKETNNNSYRPVSVLPCSNSQFYRLISITLPLRV